jgi:hypothetical protein
VSAGEAFERVASVVVAVAEGALRDRGLHRVALVDDGGPEAALAARFLERLGPGRLVRVVGAEDEPGGVAAGEERRRFRARLVEGALAAHPASKTVLLLNGPLPPEPLLPLGDLWASEVEALHGACSAPAEIAALAAQAGGFAELDGALRALIDGRDPDGLAALGGPVRAGVERKLAAGAAARRWPLLVPRMGSRTLGMDLFE